MEIQWPDVLDSVRVVWDQVHSYFLFATSFDFFDIIPEGAQSVVTE